MHILQQRADGAAVAACPVHLHLTNCPNGTTEHIKHIISGPAFGAEGVGPATCRPPLAGERLRLFDVKAQSDSQPCKEAA